MKLRKEDKEHCIALLSPFFTPQKIASMFPELELKTAAIYKLIYELGLDNYTTAKGNRKRKAMEVFEQIERNDQAEAVAEWNHYKEQLDV